MYLTSHSSQRSRSCWSHRLEGGGLRDGDRSVGGRSDRGRGRGRAGAGWKGWLLGVGRGGGGGGGGGDALPSGYGWR